MIFFSLRKHKTTIFALLRAKITVFILFFLPGPRKNTGIYAIFSMLQEKRFSCQRHKNIVNYSRLASSKKTSKI